MAEVTITKEDEQKIAQFLETFDDYAQGILDREVHYPMTQEERDHIVSAYRKDAEDQLRVYLLMNAVMRRLAADGIGTEESRREVTTSGETYRLFTTWDDPRIKEISERCSASEADVERARALIFDEMRKGGAENIPDLEEQVRREGLWRAYSGQGSLTKAAEGIEAHINLLCEEIVPEGVSA